MLGLAEQIGGADFAVDRIVGDNQRLGRPGEEIDADAAEQLPLGFGDIGVAGSDDHVDRRDGLGAERHGGNRLHAAKDENLVGAAEMHRRHDRGMRPAVKRRRAGDDVLHPGDAGGDDRHMRRRHHRIAPARHVTADRIHRNVAVPEHHAGQRLDVEIAQRFLLLLGEVAHLRLGELDVVEIALLHLADGALDFGWAELERGRRPVVEFLRQVAHGGILARIDIGKDFLDRLAHLGVRRLDRDRVHSALEVLGHDVSPYSAPSWPDLFRPSTTSLLSQSKDVDPLDKPGGDGRICDYAADYLIACGLIGEPVPPVMISGGPQKKNS